jgi:predicted DNA-binding transcriptional regulator AlpA
MTERAMQDRDAARYIGMSVSFLKQSRMNGDRENHTPGPPYVKIGRSVRYLRDDLDRWLEQYRREVPQGREEE